MNSIREFPFKKARRVTKREVDEGRAAIESLTGRQRSQRRGRPPKAEGKKYLPISIRIHPLALAWLKKEAKRRGIPYQTIINELLLSKAA